MFRYPAPPTATPNQKSLGTKTMKNLTIASITQSLECWRFPAFSSLIEAYTDARPGTFWVSTLRLSKL